MRIVLSGGGTAGHINPALALAEQLCDRGHEVVYAGTPDGVEARLVPAAGIEFHPFDAEGFDRANIATLLPALRKTRISTKKAIAWFGGLHPDAVVAFGGYVCLPVGFAAYRTGVPLVIHEQNSVMGMANKDLARHAQAVCLTYACSAKGIDPSKVAVTGNPVRRKVLQATRGEGRALYGIPDDATVLLVFGGSRGARQVNTAIAAMKDELLSRPGVHVIHITGPKELETVRAQLALTPDQARRYAVLGYQDRMGETLAAADAIVSRAGATSLAEISARAIPALLVPFPYATADHQTTNARAYVDEGCAYMIPDAETETPAFRKLVCDLVDKPELRAAMTQAARAQKTADAAARLADVVELQASRKR